LPGLCAVSTVGDCLWKHWAGQTFTGFSLDTILLQGGHAFPSSVEVGLGGEGGETTSRWLRCLGALFGGKEAARIRKAGIRCNCSGGSGSSIRMWP
jgi:hypothetical protein